MSYFKLDENKNVLESSLEEYSNFIAGKLPTNYMHVGDSKIDGYRISTIFIGSCFSFDENSNPLTFETCIFNKNDHSIYQKRYTSWQEAEEGHNNATEWVKSKCKENEC